MTEQEAREIIAEIRTLRPRKRVGRELYELRQDGRVDEYRMNKTLTRAVFERTIDAWKVIDPDVRQWLRSRGARV